MKSPSPLKILVIAESIDIEDSSGSKANVALIQNLKDSGFNITVYHYTRKDIHLADIECVSIKEKKWNSFYIMSRLQRKFQNNFGILIHKPLENAFGFSFTFYNDVKSISESLEKLNFLPDLIITLSKGASFRPHYAMLKVPDLHSKWLAYIHDPYPFHLYPDPYQWSEPGFKQKISFFKQVSEKCRWGGFPSLLLKDWMSKFYTSFNEKSIIIPHQLRKIDLKKKAKPPYFETEKFTLLHAGSLLKQRPPFNLINSYHNFLKKNPSAVKDSALYLFGSNSYHKHKLVEIQKEIPQLYLSKGYVGFDEVQLLQSIAKVNVILESKAELSPFLPGKFPHCIAAGKPILLLGPEKSESRRLLGENYQWWAETDDLEKITNLIEELYLRWKEDPKLMNVHYDQITEYLSSSHLKYKIESLFK